MKKLPVLLLLIFPSFSYAQEFDLTRVVKVKGTTTKLGADNFVTYFNTKTLLGIGVVDIIQTDTSQFSSVKTDPRVQRSGEYVDYYRSGYYPNQIIPSEFVNATSPYLKETYYGTNILPSELIVSDLLKQIDHRLVRRLAEVGVDANSRLVMITGPILAEESATFGYHELGVPAAIFKALLKLDASGSVLSYVSFIVPQDARLSDIRYYLCTIASIEERAGVTFTCFTNTKLKAQFDLGEWEFILDDGKHVNDEEEIIRKFDGKH